MNAFIILNPKDTVGVALQDIPEGTKLSTDKGDVTLKEEVKRGHKFALQDIAANEDIVKYGFPIGHATEASAKGAWVHTHNTKTN